MLNPGDGALLVTFNRLINPINGRDPEAFWRLGIPKCEVCKGTGLCRACIERGRLSAECEMCGESPWGQSLCPVCTGLGMEPALYEAALVANPDIGFGEGR